MLKKKLLLASLFCTILLQAQVSQGGIPRGLQSILKATGSIKTYTTRPIQTDILLQEDKANPFPFRYGVNETIHADIKKEGNLHILSNGRLWLLQIESTDALALGVLFDKFEIPESAELYVYNPYKPIIYGAFTQYNNKAYKKLRVADYPGNKIIIEYFEPTNATFEGSVVIQSVTKAYKPVNDEYSFSDTEGYVNIACPPGNHWQLTKRSVCRIIFTEGNYNYLCSGALINNVRNDGTPYFLTANHCISTLEAAQSMVVYFNYEATECSYNNSETIMTLSGGTFRAGFNQSDFTLIELNEVPPTSYKAYYAGWSISDTGHTSSFGIHHPEGLVKKISLDNEAPSIDPYESLWYISATQTFLAGPNTHFDVEFDLGATAGGSSGSPLFNQEQKIIGQLHGGSSNYLLSYGMLSVSWDSLEASNKQLKYWLDPDNTGVTELNGYYNNNLSPAAQFNTPVTSICQGTSVTLTDQSVYAPKQWQWQVTPNTIDYVDSTNSTSRNPVIRFNQQGVYSISLTVANENGADSLTRNGYITVSDTIAPVVIEPVTGTKACYGVTTRLKYLLYNADSFSIILPDSFSIPGYELDSTILRITLNDSHNYNQTNTPYFFIIGHTSGCTDTIKQTISIVRQNNDSIVNAYPLQPGDNGFFSNECATTEANEPSPPLSNCNTQSAWCDECLTGDSALQNTIWFTFIGPENGTITINTDGFDNQLAIYDAASASDLLMGNYFLIAANDDYNPDDYSASIKNARVIPGKKYWLQLDGSACGAIGKCKINLDSNNTTSAINTIADKAAIFPIPVGNTLNIETKNNNLPAKVIIYNYQGILMLSVAKENTIDVSSLPPGNYIIHVIGNQFIHKSGFIKK